MNQQHASRPARAGLAALVAMITVVFAGLVGLGLAAPANAAGGQGQEVCPDLSTGKISSSSVSVTYTAPEGKLIDAYCVKAGSDGSTTDGAVQMVSVNPPQASVTITHYSGKNISHYSVSLIDPPATCPVGTDKAGQVIPGDQTEAWCTVTVIPTCETDATLCPPQQESTTTTTTAVAAPATVAAPAPATVAAPAAATRPLPAKVVAPAKATLPARIPAGDGSSAPTAPIGALLLIALGVVGAAVAGRQVLGARR